MFVEGDVYDCDDGGVWTVDYEGLSCCGNNNVCFSGYIKGKHYGKTLDREEAYKLRADGKLRKRGQLDLFFINLERKNDLPVMPQKEK